LCEIDLALDFLLDTFIGLVVTAFEVDFNYCYKLMLIVSCYTIFDFLAKSFGWRLLSDCLAKLILDEIRLLVKIGLCTIIPKSLNLTFYWSPSSFLFSHEMLFKCLLVRCLRVFWFPRFWKLAILVSLDKIDFVGLNPVVG
jgi:hypothetical protein